MNIHVVQAGVHYRHGADFVIDRPHGAGEFVFICSHTPVRMSLKGRTGVEPAGTCALFRPDSSYHYEAVGARFDNTWFHATGNGLEEWVTGLGLPLDTPMRPGRSEYVVPLVHEISLELSQPGLHAGIMAGLAAQKLLSLVARHLSTRPGAALTPALLEHLERLRQVRMHVLENVDRRWTVADMAARAHLSPSRFSAIYRRCFDISPMDDLIRARLDRAAWLLSTTHAPVGAIASQCGFENIYYFSRLFRQRLGHPPSQHGRTG